ncbi:RNA polymerase sigma-70 factor [Edaphobacter sp. 12200R-103]|uniref:RNA polymerase sigma-70 factor n=1 Tax=Edaphobacter sp. 12200R-103 TaxID=2703788 RepID=UPI00138BAE2D|nr:RNA polymerase sigma-70 factor [Edaphobacter sp. 12200R-103]QHS53081.1 RNA polymerase sigma-70 factor [Edaphobacter sp. 12200R-103]
MTIAMTEESTPEMLSSGLSSGAGEYDDALLAFSEVRPRLFGIAYRMLGSAAEAEDITQDVWLRWQATDRSVVENPPAFLATITTRMCINFAQSARSRREIYVGPWLPEPVDTSSDPLLGAERGEALELAVLLLLEKLSPTERAAYVLREAFDYSYRQIADILQMEEPNIRQLVSRARKHISNGRRTPVSSDEQRRLLEIFIDAAQKGDISALEDLFAEDVVSYSDGGGVIRTAARALISGRERVAKFITAFASHFWAGVSLRWLNVNGQISVLISHGGMPATMVMIDASAEGIHQVMWIMRPSKLTAVSAVRSIA